MHGACIWISDSQKMLRALLLDSMTSMSLMLDCDNDKWYCDKCLQVDNIHVALHL